MNLTLIKKKINPEKELFIWGPIDFKLFYGSHFIETILFKVTKYYPWPWPANLCISKNQRLTFINDYDDLRKVGEKYFKRYFLNLKNYKSHWLTWQKWVKEYKIIENKYSKINFLKISGKELFSLFKEFYEFNRKFWLIVHVPEIANWGGELLLNKILKEINRDKTEEYLEILSAPVEYSFFQQEELDLLRTSFIKNKKEFREVLEKHAQKYYWILNSYGGNQVLKINYFRDKLKELLRGKIAKNKIKEIENIIKNSQRRKEYLIRKLKLNKKIILIARQLSQSIWWQDLRKGYIWRMNYFWDKFLKEIARRTKWSFDDLLWCWPGEVIRILQNQKVDKRKILSRKKYYATYTEIGNMKHLFGKQARDLVKIYLEAPVGGKIKELKGLTVSKGKEDFVRGKAKIITNPFRDLKKMKRGDILVASMTSPEFIIAMKKAKAIITDHGGITSHAAIVSRELRVTCVVDTKIATKVLKDGNLVEVDANKGIVKILK
jgi:phosphohistidine swiveling domain-containing protein